MELFVLWCGFIGAWLLFAGPILQAALELKEEDIQRARLHTAKQQVQIPRNVSNWWWLLPPVKFFLEQRQSRKFHAEYFKILAPEDLESLISFVNKARGWLLVASGALLIAIKETYELGEELEWPHWVFWTIIVVFILGSLLNTVRQMTVAKKLTRQQN